MGNYLFRVKQIKIGYDAAHFFVWTGVRSCNWHDTSPWVYIDVPGGTKVRHHLISPQVLGEIDCLDITALQTALYATVIDTVGHFAVTSAGAKYKVGYCVATLIDQTGAEVTYTFEDFRVEIINVEPIDIKETIIKVKFEANTTNKS